MHVKWVSHPQQGTLRIQRQGPTRHVQPTMLHHACTGCASAVHQASAHKVAVKQDIKQQAIPDRSRHLVLVTQLLKRDRLRRLRLRQSLCVTQQVHQGQTHLVLQDSNACAAKQVSTVWGIASASEPVTGHTNKGAIDTCASAVPMRQRQHCAHCPAAKQC